MSESSFDFKFGIMAIRPAEVEGMVDILHFCGYEEKPTKADYNVLREELASDEEFGLIASMDDITLVEAPDTIVRLYKEMLATDPNWHEAN